MYSFVSKIIYPEILQNKLQPRTDFLRSYFIHDYRYMYGVEDEFHFLLECRLYNEIRKKYIKKYYWGRPNMIKLKELMITNNERMLLNLAIYTERAFKIRSDLYINL